LSKSIFHLRLKR